MRTKRAKQYKKLMKQYSYFGFREPYQVLVDAEMVKDVSRFHMDLTAALERTLRGKSKPMITQCSIRHLYSQASEPGMAAVIDLAKTCERRRCGHHPEYYPTPLSTLDCLTSVVDPQSNGMNKHNYVVASQSQDLRQALRQVRSVPLIYVSRSVMILEPMASATAQVRSREEHGKFRDGLLKTETGKKRKRDDEVDAGGAHGENNDGDDGNAPGIKPSDQISAPNEPERKKSKRKHGPKGPNPLSVKKSTKRPANRDDESKTSKPKVEAMMKEVEPVAKRKRRRKQRAAAEERDNRHSEGRIEAPEE